MTKYVVKHLNINHLEDTNAFLKFIPDINMMHTVFKIEEATHFETKKRANYMRNKFKHPEYWEVISYEKEKIR